tara:strand:- start:1940 stop:3589 length:1650 start_codon:yes stop_codon:yes gene_type:complete
MTPKELREQADHLFTKKLPLNNLHQEIAENFYPERADFTTKRYLGDDYAGNLMTSYPTLCRRDLGDSIATMLRNTSQPWFEMATTDPRREDNEAKAWLQWATGLQRRAMYDPDAALNKACKLGDHDFATFGQAVLTARLNRDGDTLLYRCYHLRDVSWMEDEDGKICCVFRRWKPACRDLVRLFGKGSYARPKNSVHANITRMAAKKPFEEVECLHMMVKSDMYDDKDNKPWRSIYYDCQNNHVMESVGQWTKEYVIPRWQTLGSQYAISPATTIALPDARLLQAMTATILEAGEKIVNPAMIATQQAVRSDMDITPGGVTWVEYDYDERLGAALRPMTTDAKGMPLTQEMQRDCRALLSQCFYLNKIKPFLPSQDKEMTAFQAGQIVAQYIRDALPLFEPMEAEYNGALCNETFEVLMRGGAFGPPQTMPRSLQGADIKFHFKSPLHEAIESQKGQKFLQMGQMIAQAMQLDKSVAALPDAAVALRDALDGIGVPAKWVRSEVTVEQMKAQAQAQEQAAQQLAIAQQGADVVQKLGGAVSDMQMAKAA